MGALIKVSGVVTIGFIILMITGCSAFVIVNERAMSIDDVINLTKAEASSDVIIRQIEATNSRFELEADDIVRLKNEGVEDDVIEFMIETGYTPQRMKRDYNYAPYDYWYNYYNRFYYPYYDYYYNPDAYYLYGGVPYYRHRSPYIVRRRPGLVGRHYEYYPSTPLYYERDYNFRDRFYGRELEEYEESGE